MEKESIVAGKKIKLASIICSSVIVLVAIFMMCFFFIPRNPNIVDSDIFNINQEKSTVSCSVDNDTDNFSLNDSIKLPRTNSWNLYYDMQGLKEIPSKTVNLQVGNNTYYIIVKNTAGEQKVYTVNIRRKPLYVVTFNTNGGESIINQIIQEGNLATYEEPSKEGYIFNGWDFDFSNPITSNLTITASWIAQNLTINYFSNNGVDLSLLQNVTYDSSVMLKNSSVFTFKGFTLSGWNTAVDGSGIQYSASQYFNKYKIASDLDLYAQWTRNKYDIVVNSNLADAGTINGEGSYDYESTQTISAFTNNGYTWQGWYSKNNELLTTSQSMKVTLSDSDVEYIAKWSANKYIITFNFNGGEELVDNTKEVTFGQNFALPIATRTEASFLGWFDENGTQITDNQGQSISTWNKAQNTTLFAQYQINTYQVSLNKNIEKAGTVDGSGLKEYHSQVTVVANTTDDGYSFVGWFEGTILLTQDERYSFIMQNYPLTYTAKWQANDYEVSLNVGYGDALEDSKRTITYDSTFTLPVPTREGYEFGGWYTGINSSGIQLTNGQGNSFSSWNITNNIELFAEWILIDYSLVYVLNDGTVATENPVSYTIEDLDIKINNPSKVGYIFDGWLGTGLNEATKELTIKAGSVGNKIFGAKWSKSDEFIAISTPNDLMQIASDLDGYFYLTQDIDMTDIEFDTIGDEENTFTGAIEGNGFAISNLTIENYFIYSLKGTITNLEIENISVTGDSGTMLVHTNDGIVRNCKLNGLVDITGKWKGYGEDNTAYATGIAVINNGLIENVIVSGDIKVQGPNSSSYIVDRIESTFAYKNNGTIKYCYSNANVYANGTYGMTYGAGFVYKNDGEIQNSFICGKLKVSGWGSAVVAQRCGVDLFEYTRYNQTGMQNCYILESAEITLYESGQSGGYYHTLTITKIADSKVIDNSLLCFGNYVSENDLVINPQNVWVFDGINHPTLYWQGESI